MKIGDLSHADVDAKKLLTRPRDFGYGGENEAMFVTWTLGPVIEHRDSGLLDKSNARVLRREIAKAAAEGVIEPDSYEEISCTHWAVGHVDHLTYRVLDDAGEVTNVARWIDLWFGYLREQYPVADSSDYCELEAEATEDNVKDAAGWLAGRLDVDLPGPGEKWLGDLLDWLHENRESALENRNDQGGYPSDDVLTEAFEALGWYKPETGGDDDE